MRSHASLAGQVANKTAIRRAEILPPAPGQDQHPAHHLGLVGHREANGFTEPVPVFGRQHPVAAITQLNRGIRQAQRTGDSLHHARKNGFGHERALELTAKSCDGLIGPRTISVKQAVDPPLNTGPDRLEHRSRGHRRHQMHAGTHTFADG